ncbi:Cyclin-dependent kinase 2 [Rhizophlyctis rosea]|nr:Cyclin-dependent kinase 2 [Rhizophlyctis rosea]
MNIRLTELEFLKAQVAMLRQMTEEQSLVTESLSEGKDWDAVVEKLRKQHQQLAHLHQAAQRLRTMRVGMEQSLTSQSKTGAQTLDRNKESLTSMDDDLAGMTADLDDLEQQQRALNDSRPRSRGEIGKEASPHQTPQLIRSYLWQLMKGDIFFHCHRMDHDLKENMDSVLGRLAPQLIRSYLWQLMKGINFCQCHRILHRDLKTQHLLIDHEGNLKLADFGLARTFGIPLRTYTHEVVTLWYRAPEILLGSKHYSTVVDMWTVGCIFAELCSGRPFFGGDSQIDEIFRIFRRHVAGHPTTPRLETKLPNWAPQDLSKLLPNLEPEGIDLLSKLLAYDPANRISARRALAHPYFNVKQPYANMNEFPVYTQFANADGQVDMANAQELGTYQIFVRTLGGRMLVVDVDSSMCIGEVKTQIQDRGDCPSHLVVLMYRGRCLDERFMLSEYDIEAHSTLHVTGRLRGGNKADTILDMYKALPWISDKEREEEKGEWVYGVVWTGSEEQGVAIQGCLQDNRCQISNMICSMPVPPSHYIMFLIVKGQPKHVMAVLTSQGCRARRALPTITLQDLEQAYESHVSAGAQDNGSSLRRRRSIGKSLEELAGTIKGGLQAFFGKDDVKKPVHDEVSMIGVISHHVMKVNPVEKDGEFSGREKREKSEKGKQADDPKKLSVMLGVIRTLAAQKLGSVDQVIFYSTPLTVRDYETGGKLLGSSGGRVSTFFCAEDSPEMAFVLLAATTPLCLRPHLMSRETEAKRLATERADLSATIRAAKEEKGEQEAMRAAETHSARAKTLEAKEKFYWDSVTCSCRRNELSANPGTEVPATAIIDYLGRHEKAVEDAEAESKRKGRENFTLKSRNADLVKEIEQLKVSLDVAHEELSAEYDGSDLRKLLSEKQASAYFVQCQSP